MPTALARRFKVDVSIDGTTWVPLRGIDDLNPNISNTLQGVDDYDSNGFSAVEKTMISWVLTIKTLRRYAAGYIFDAGQELVRAAQLQFGTSARVYVRWYDRNGAPEAFSGLAIVGYTASKTGVADVDEVSITLTGDGILSPITNPGVVTATVPTVTAVSPANAGSGTSVAITGVSFTGTTAVKFGGTNATSYAVINDQLITAILPTAAAGSAPVTVTNATGTSAAAAYSRGA